MVLWRFFGPGGSIRQLHQLELRIGQYGRFYCAGSKARCSKSYLGLFSEGYVSDWYLDNGGLLENIINMNNMNLMGKLFVVMWWPWQKVPVENSNKNHKNIVQKCVDVSTFSRYYRDSFWIQNLFTEAKHKNSQNNSTLYKDRFSSQLPVFFWRLPYLSATH